MINRNLNEREKGLIKILLIILFLLTSKLFIINPINLKISELENNKQNIINMNNMENKIIGNSANKIKEDIVLILEKELKQFVNIDYIDKKIVWDENNNDLTNIEIKIRGSLDNIFKIQEIISKLELEKDIRYMEINKISNINDSEVESEEILDCIIEINVG